MKLRLLFLIALFVLFSTTLAFGATGEYLKVGLSYGYTEVYSATLRCDGGLQIGEITEEGYDIINDLEGVTKLTVSISDGVISVTTEDGTIITPDLGTDGVIVPEQEGDVVYFASNGYRGGYCFYPDSSGKMDVINYVTLEDYVRGVLNSEIGYSSPIETLKAQAICARSYAVCNIGRHRAAGYDICATTHCQVYRGYQNEYPSTNQACDETEGLVITYDSKPVTGFYSKNDGGHTDNVEDVWGSFSGYLRGVEDEFAPVYSWNIGYTATELSKILESAGYGVGNLTKLEITSRNSSGTVREMKIQGSDGSKIITGNAFRNILGANVLKSGMFAFSPLKSYEELGSVSETIAVSTEPEAVFNTGSVVTTNGNTLKTYETNLSVIDKDGVVRLMNTSELCISNGQETVIPSAPDQVSDSQIAFYGLGWGHGVGMAQDSIIAMGKQGYDYEYMLDYFFTNIEIEKWEK